MSTRSQPSHDEDLSGIWCGRQGKVWLPFDAILNESRFKDGDSVLIAGSLVEGLGDDESDVNVYVIRKDGSDLNPTLPSTCLSTEVPYTGIASGEGKVQLTTTSWPEGLGRSVVVEYWHASVFEQALRSLNEAVTEARNYRVELFLKSPPFRVSRAYHALCIGFPLVGAERLSALRALVPISDYCFMRFNEIAGNHADFVDVVGAYRSGDYLRALDLAVQFVTVQMLALTYLHFNTNFRRKWLLQHILRLPPNCEGISSTFVECAYGRQGSLQSFKSRTEECMKLVDRIFIEFARVLKEHKHFPTTDRLLKGLGEISASNYKDEKANSILLFRKSVIGEVTPFCATSLVVSVVT